MIGAVDGQGKTVIEVYLKEKSLKGSGHRLQVTLEHGTPAAVAENGNFVRPAEGEEARNGGSNL